MRFSATGLQTPKLGFAMKKCFLLQVLCFVLASVSYSAQFDPGAKVLGEKSAFQHADRLKEVDAMFLEEERDGGMCMGGDIHNMPKLEVGEEFVVGFPTRDGGENLVYIWNSKGAQKHLHCIFEPELKAHYYFIAPEFVERTMLSCNGSDWAKIFKSRYSPEKLKFTILGQGYYYFLGERTFKNLLKEMNTDMLTHVFISPLVRAHGFKVFTDIESNVLQLFVQRIGNTKRYGLGTCDDLNTSSQIMQKIAQFAADNFEISSLFNFPEGFAVPDIGAFDEQQHVSQDALETMVLYYVNALKKVDHSYAIWDSPAVERFSTH